jgi:hypothetical protein
MRKGSNMLKRLILLVLIFSVCLSPLGCAEKISRDESESTKYTLYVGLNDKDTLTQIIPAAEAEKRLGDIAIKYVDGFTLSVGDGAYRDEKGALKREPSIIAEFYFTTEEQIKKIMDEALQEFNQNAILVAREQVNAEIYEKKP